MGIDGPRTLRVQELCNLLDRDPPERLPALLDTQLHAVCDARALNGRPELLDVDEAEYLAATNPLLFTGNDRYVDAEEILDFTATLAAAYTAGVWHTEPPTFGKIAPAEFFQGLAHVSEAEPPFAVGATVVRKVAAEESFESATQTLLINGVWQLEFSRLWQQGALTYTCTPQEACAQFLSGSDAAALLDLPFLPSYDAVHREDAMDRAAFPAGDGDSYWVGHVEVEMLRAVVEKQPIPKESEVSNRSFVTASTPIYLDAAARFYYEGALDGLLNIPAYFSRPAEVFSAYVVRADGELSLYRARDAAYREPRYASGCFTGAMQLVTPEGPMAFTELHDRFQHGEPLPAVRSFDVAARTWVYQQPAAVIRHDVVERIRLLSTLDANGVIPAAPAALEVTENHFLWARRGGQELWIEAGAVRARDALLGAEGDSTTWLPVSSNVTLHHESDLAWRVEMGVLLAAPQQSLVQMQAASGTGALAVYTLAFERADQAHDASIHHNFVVCAGDTACIVARNKMF